MKNRTTWPRRRITDTLPFQTILNCARHCKVNPVTSVFILLFLLFAEISPIRCKISDQSGTVFFVGLSCPNIWLRALVGRSWVQSTTNCKSVRHTENVSDRSTQSQIPLRRKRNEKEQDAQDVYNFLFMAQTIQRLDYVSELARNTGFDSRQRKKISLFSTSSWPAVMRQGFLFEGSYLTLHTNDVERIQKEAMVI